jgi:hypothetical protein
VEQNERKFDRFSGNVLESFEWNGNQFLACPRGVTLNTLSIYQLDMLHNTLLIPSQSVLECTFKTPIKQVKHHHQYLIARTFAGLHMISMDGTDRDLLTDWQPRHFACNSVLRNQLAILSDDGKLYLWDIQNAVSKICKDDLAKSHYEWTSFEFGSHPLSLLLGNSAHIRHLDTRSNTFDDIYSASETNLFTSMKRHPKKPFQLALSTQQSTLLIDTRYVKQAMLEWKINDFHESQFNLEFLEGPSGMNHFATDCMYNWGRHFGETLLYCYEEKYGMPLTSTHVQKLKPFYDHLFFTDCKENIHPPTLIENISFKRKVEQKESMPPWPALIGCKLIPNCHTGKDLTFFQFTTEGSLFAQSYRFQKVNDSSPALVHELEIDLHSIESEVYLEMKELATNEFMKDEEADHDLIDFTPMWKLCEQGAKQSDWKVFERASTPEPDSTTVSSL